MQAPHPSRSDDHPALRRSARISHRYAGLDAVRACAIWLVMISHGITNLPVPDTTRYDPTVACTATVGVEMFFALSGFLIGRILLDIEAEGFSRELVWRFLVRRWLRTLPVYYAFLAVTIVLWPKVEATAPKFLIMAQSFFSPTAKPNEFPQSWSLPIEEFSYILLPIAALAFSWSRRALLVVALCFIAWSFFYRAFYVDTYPFLVMRTITVARLDAIVYGVLAAMVERHCLEFYRRHQTKILAVALVLIAYHAFRFTEPGSLRNFYGRVLALPLFSLGVSAILPAAGRGGFGPSILQRFIRFTSDRAYTLYIVHIVVAAGINVTLHDMPLGLQGVVFVFSSYALAGLFTLLVERPFLRLRPSQLPA